MEIIDFIGKCHTTDLSDFFLENPHFRLIKYEPIKGGIRAFYIIVQ